MSDATQSQETPTPRVDAARKRVSGFISRDHSYIEVVPLEVARTLERDLALAETELARLRQELQRARGAHVETASEATSAEIERDSLRAELAAAKEETKQFCSEMARMFGVPILRLGDAACFMGKQFAEIAALTAERDSLRLSLQVETAKATGIVRVLGDVTEELSALRAELAAAKEELLQANIAADVLRRSHWQGTDTLVQERNILIAERDQLRKERVDLAMKDAVIEQRTNEANLAVAALAAAQEGSAT